MMTLFTTRYKYKTTITPVYILLSCIQQKHLYIYIYITSCDDPKSFEIIQKKHMFVFKHEVSSRWVL